MEGRDLAEAPAEAVERVEGNVYFPADRVQREYLQPSDTHTTCGWKGTASYYHVAVDGEVNRDAAWYYPEPKEAARTIAGHIAFWKGSKSRTIDSRVCGTCAASASAEREQAVLACDAPRHVPESRSLSASRFLPRIFAIFRSLVRIITIETAFAANARAISGNTTGAPHA